MITKQDRIKWGTMGAVSKWSKQPPREERFWAKVKIGPIDQCWPWNQGLQPTGYGRVRYGGVQDMAHRVVYRLHYKDFDPSLAVLHKCDNRPCCNPHHLFQGTLAENVADMVSKGRQRGPRHHGMQKLTDLDVLTIRHMWSKGNWTQGELAGLFHVTRNHIGGIINGRKRAHVQPPMSENMSPDQEGPA